MIEWQPIFLSVKLSLVVTVLLLVVGIPLAYWLAYTRNTFKPFLESLVSLPLVLPPTVLGFYLLVAFSPGSAVGSFLLQWFDLRLVFSFEGLVFASVIYSLPFMVHPVQAGFQGLPVSLKDAAYTLGVSPFRTFLKVLLPNIKSSILTGVILTFAHTIGEFGVVLMIGGNIPGISRVASIAIYDEVEKMNYQAAGVYSGILLMLCFVILLIMFSVNRKLRLRI